MHSTTTDQQEHIFTKGNTKVNYLRFLNNFRAKLEVIMLILNTIMIKLHKK